MAPKGNIDHILINKKWKNSAIDCAAYNTFHSVSSDHKLFTIKCRLCLRANKSRKYLPKFDWSKLMCNKDIKEKFPKEIKNRFEALQSDNNTDNDPSTMYNISWKLINMQHLRPYLLSPKDPPLHPGTPSPLKSNTMLFHKL